MTRIYDGLLFGTTVLFGCVLVLTAAGWIYDRIVRRDIHDHTNPKEDRT